MLHYAFICALLSTPAPQPVVPATIALINTTSLAMPVQVQTPTDEGFNFSYDYAEGSIYFGDFTGFKAAASYHLEDHWILAGSFERGSQDVGVADLTLTSFGIGGGYVENFGEGLDLVGTAQLEFGQSSVKVIGSSASESEVGLRFRGGARYQAMPHLEVFGGLEVRTIFDNNFSLDVGARYDLTDRFSVYADLDIGDSTTFNLGVRYGF